MLRGVKYLIAAGLTLVLMVSLAFYFASFITSALTLDCGNGVRLELVKIPAGKFVMGSPESEEGRGGNEVRHPVNIGKSFYLGIHEVTQAQYQAVMGANPSQFKGGQLPVETVSWEDAREFCRRLSAKTGKNLRLPTEAEWEYACRAGTTTVYHNGNDPEALAKAGNAADAELRKTKPDWTTIAASDGYGAITAPAGKFRPNAWGLYDMHGNVWEWCSDWLGDYDPNGGLDPKGAASGSNRVLRGGSWSSGPGLCRSAARGGHEPGFRYDVIGFRVALD